MRAENAVDRPVRVLIADDEPLARGYMRRLLAEVGDFLIVAEASDGRDALALLRLQSPDVAFLDVRMPYVDGIQTAREATSNQTLFTFITAYDRHAVEAFEAGGIDYLLKPIDRDRFRLMIDKVRREVRRRRVAAIYNADAATEVPPATPSRQLQVRIGSEIRFVRPADIEWLEAANQYVYIHLAVGLPILVSDSLSAFHRRLEESGFFRVHRSAVVNRAHIVSIHTDGAGGAFLVLKGNARVPVSRRFRKLLSRVAPLSDGGR